ncbi:MAG TPA: nucleotide exchange factor GrpE [Nocardioidaceae bacterium]|nr:nucleotide exchange factor GrpE [Nocardioidaceae bacterium]
MSQEQYPTEPQRSADDERGPAETPASAPADPPGTEPADQTDEEPDELDVAQRAVTALTDDLKRLQAEYVNYKRRVDRDRELVLQNAKFSVLAAMLPVLDDLDRAREHGELEGGFKAVADSLERIVAAQGLIKFGRPGDEFDPRFHEALLHSHSPDVTATTCQTIVSAGYQIGDRVVRPARVTVVDPEPSPGEPFDGAQEPPAETDETDEQTPEE